MSNVQFVQVAYGIAILGLVGYWLSVQRRLRRLAGDRRGAPGLEDEDESDEYPTD